jgi:outer membrane protein assembly factor BamB
MLHVAADGSKSRKVKPSNGAPSGGSGTCMRSTWPNPSRIGNTSLTASNSTHSAHDGSETSRSFRLRTFQLLNGVVYIGSTDGNVYALNASTGLLKWATQTDGGIESSPAVVNGVVYIGNDQGDVFALNGATGLIKWGYGTGGTVASSPAVFNGTVYVGSGDDDTVYALNAANGSAEWTTETGGSVVSSPAVANGVVYVGADEASIYAMDAGNGGVLWAGTTGGGIESSPTVANGVVYVGSDDASLYAYSLGVVLEPNRPSPSSLHPNYGLTVRRRSQTNRTSGHTGRSRIRDLPVRSGAMRFPRNGSWHASTGGARRPPPDPGSGPPVSSACRTSAQIRAGKR